MCRRQYKWKKETLKTKEIPSVDTLEETLEERLEVLIREDDENQFLSIVGMNSKAFEVILNRQNIIQFIVVLETQIDTETLKFLIKEFVANNFTQDDIIGSLRSPSFSHFRNIDSHLESFYDNLVIKKYRNE